MNKSAICNQIMEIGEILIGLGSRSIDKGGALAAAAYAAVATWFGGLVLSEAAIIKAFFLSLGVLMGAAFSDFFKKHKGLVLFVLIGSAILFCYKVLTEMEEAEDF